MFGYVRPCLESLDEGQQKRYRAWYCGLCRSLGERHGLRGRMTLTYDMTFLAIFLSALYEPEETKGQGRCVPHPGKAHDYVRTAMTDYAADMTVALAYFNALDDWQDDRSLPGGLTAKLLKGRYEQVKALYPRQCSDMEQHLHALSAVEEKRENTPDAAANCFGALMASLFVREEDYWSRTLRIFGASLGRFVYMMDAACDYDADVRKEAYNPIVLMNRQPEEMREVMTILLGDASAAFETLPIVSDADILRNILYEGIWQRYNESIKRREDKKKKHGEPQDGAEAAEPAEQQDCPEHPERPERPERPEQKGE